MKRLRIIFLLAMLTAGATAFSQVYRFVTTGFSVSERDAKGNWSKWSPLEKASIIVTLDTKKNRIIIYSQEVQLYNIVTYQPDVETDDDLIYAFSCSDEDGMPFTISIITRKKQGGRKQLYIAQKNYMVMYNIENYKG